MVVQKITLESFERMAGVGIASVHEPLARRYIREGSLNWLLPQTAVKRDGLFHAPLPVDRADIFKLTRSTLG